MNSVTFIIIKSSRLWGIVFCRKNRDKRKYVDTLCPLVLMELTKFNKLSRWKLTHVCMVGSVYIHNMKYITKQTKITFRRYVFQEKRLVHIT